MRVLLTGGSGDLGSGVAEVLATRGDEPILFDVRSPEVTIGKFIQGSITDRSAIEDAMTDIDCVVHIAAWHGIHEARGDKDVYDFWSVNVTGTFEVFEAAVRTNVKQFIYISSTSIDDRFGIYGHTKVLGEEIAHVYQKRHAMNVIILRPRAFIPPWNTYAYQNFVEWAEWFWGGAVHLKDVVQSVIKSIDYMQSHQLEEVLTLVVDGAYDFTDEEFEQWDQAGAGTTFAKRFPEYVSLVQQFGLDPARKPRRKEITLTRQMIGYEPTYSLKNLLEELAIYAESTE